MPDLMESAVRRSVTHTLRDGRIVELKQPTIHDFMQIREQSLHEYKRESLATYGCIADPAERLQLTREEAERLRSITYDDLPDRSAGNDKVEHMQWWMMQPDGLMYTIWLCMRKSDSHPRITLQEVIELFDGQEEELQTIADMVADLAEAKLEKNSPAPGMGANEKRQQRRERRRRRKAGH